MDHPMFTNASAWIWSSAAEQINCYLEFCTEFAVAENGGETNLFISVEGQYVAMVDGVCLDSSQYPDYPQRKSVQCVKLSALSAGQHELRIQTHYDGQDTSVTRKEQPGLRFELRQGDTVLVSSGTQTQVRVMNCYQNGPIANITGQLGFGFSWAIKEELPWQNAEVVEKECAFVPRPIPELTVEALRCGRLFTQGVFTAHESGLQQFASLSFRERWQMTKTPEQQLPAEKGICFRSEEGDGIYLIVDLGKESVGYLDIDAVCPTNTRVDIGFGEHLDDLRVRTDVGGRHFTVQWEAGPKRDQFVHRFLRLGCRNLQLFFYGSEATIYHVGLRPVDYPVRAEAQFKSCDSLMDKIFAVSKDTLRCSMHDHYEDCPWREQALYAFDSRNQMLSGYYAFGEFTQPRESLRTMALSLREDGLLELCSPARVEVDIPSFSLVFVTAVEEYCRYSGDLEFGREMLPTVAAILRTAHGHFEGGLMHNYPGYWNFYEWRPLLEGLMHNSGESVDSPLQLFYLLALQRMEKLCAYLNLDAPGLREEIVAVTEGLENFWDEDAGAYASFIVDGKKVQYAQLVQSLALYTGACPETRREILSRKLLANELVPVSLAYSIFKYEALLQQSRDYAEEVFRQIAQRWGDMLYQGATTFWETDVGADDFGWAGSLCHGWSGIPTYLFGAYILGVRPEEPGIWKMQEEEPCMYYAEGKLYPPQGEMTVVCRK